MNFYDLHDVVKVAVGAADLEDMSLDDDIHIAAAELVTRDDVDWSLVDFLARSITYYSDDYLYKKTVKEVQKMLSDGYFNEHSFAEAADNLSDELSGKYTRAKISPAVIKAIVEAEATISKEFAMETTIQKAWRDFFLRWSRQDLDHRRSVARTPADVKLQIWEIVATAARTRNNSSSDQLAKDLMRAAELLGLISLDDLPKRLKRDLALLQADAERFESQFQFLRSYDEADCKKSSDQPEDQQKPDCD